QGVAAPCYRGGRRRGTLAHPAAEEPVPAQPEEESPCRARLLRVRAGGRLAVLQGSLWGPRCLRRGRRRREGVPAGSHDVRLPIGESGPVAGRGVAATGEA